MRSTNADPNGSKSPDVHRPGHTPKTPLPARLRSHPTKTVCLKLEPTTQEEKEKVVLLCHQPPTSQTHDTHRDLERATPVSITSVDDDCHSTSTLRTRTSLPFRFSSVQKTQSYRFLSQLVAGGPTPEDCPTVKSTYPLTRDP